MKEKTKQSRQFRGIPDAMTPKSQEGQGVLVELEHPKWAYKSALLPRQSDLTPYGAEGWELVTVVAQAADLAMFYFRRPKR